MANFIWNGTSTNASLASAWNNQTTGQTPATSVPGSSDTALFTSSSYAPVFINGTAYKLLAVNNNGSLDEYYTLSLGGLSVGTSGMGTLNSYGTLNLSGPIIVGQAAGSSGTVSAAFGKISVSAAADTAQSYLQVGNGAGSTGTLNVSYTTTVVDVGLNAISLGNSGTGVITVSNGGTLRAASSDSNARAAFFAGVNSGGSGTLTVTGQGSSAVINGSAAFGRAGKGTLVVDQGASFTGGKAATGDGQGANGFFSVSIGLGQSGTAATALFGGSGTATVTNKGTLHSLGNLNVGDDGTKGSLTIGGASLVYADRYINIGTGGDRPGGDGVLVVQGGSTLRAGTPPNGTAGIAIGGGQGNTGTALVTGAGTLVDTNGGRLSVATTLVAGSSVTGATAGALTIANGATVRAGSSVYTDAEGAFTVATRAFDTGTVTVTDAGSQLLVAGEAVLGGGDSGAGLVKGGSGTLNDTKGGLFRATSLVMFSGGTLNVDAASTAVIGTSAGVTGALTIDSGSLVSGTGAINGAINNNGVISTGGDPLGGTLTLNGPVSGTGSLTIGTFGSLALTGIDSEAITFADKTGSLLLSATGAALPAQGPIYGFAAGDRLVLSDAAAPVDQAVWSQSSPTGGTLTLSSQGTTVGTLNLVGDYTGSVFNLQKAGATTTIDLAGKTGGTSTAITDGSTITIGAVSNDGYVVTGSATITLDGASRGNTVVLDGTATVNDNGGNTIFGGAGGGTINGGAGPQIVVARGGALTVNGGTGGGVYFGQGTGSTIKAGTGPQSVLVGAGGDKLYSAGSAGDLFGVNGAGDVLMDGTASTGNDVFFGAMGTGNLTFLCGSGNDILGLGQGQNAVTLGAGNTTVFANTGTTAVSVITAGSGSADIGMGGSAVNFVLAAASNARTFNLFNFLSGPDKVTLNGYGANEVADAINSQKVVNGSTVLTLSDRTSLVLIGATKADASIFG